MHGVITASQGQKVILWNCFLISLMTFCVASLSRKARSTRDMLNMKQRVTLTGLGSKTFMDNIEKLEAMTTKFIRAIDSDAMTPNNAGLFEGHETIHAENR